MRLPYSIGLALVLLAAPGVATSASAQPATEQIILSAGAAGGLFSLDFNTSQFRSLSRIPMNAVITADKNAGAIGTFGDEIYRTSLVGTTATIAVLPDGAVTRGIASDQVAGDYVVATHKGVYRFNTSTAQLLTSVVKPNAICRNRNTGNFLAADGFGRIWTVDRSDGTVATVRTDVNGITGLAYLPSTGGFVVGRKGPGGVLLLDANFNTVKTFQVSDVEGVTVNERKNRIFAVHGITPRGVSEINPTGRVLGFVALPVYAFSGIALWRDRPVTMDATGAPSSTAEVELAFPDTPNATYCVALSLADHPGLPLPGGQLLNLAPDPLFMATACANVPGLTKGFVGTLSGSGRAIARFQIPAVAPIGLVVHASAVAVDAGQAGGLRVGNSDCVQISP